MSNLPSLSVSRRVRQTPWTDRLIKAGVKAFTVYNHMLLPTFFGNSPLEDYQHLREHVQVWDVSCERQVQLKGPDAFKLMQLMTPRDMGRMKELQCFYIPLVNAQGKLLNDPVALKVGVDTYWLSIASSDIKLYAMGLAIGLNLDVEITEPDIGPLGVQGPKAWDLMERVFGPEIRDIKFFRFKWLEYQGVPLIVAQSGFSGFGGFEIYVPGPEFEDRAYPTLATDLWDELFEKGEDLNVGPGGPNWLDFTEAGLLSFGNTIDYDHTPYEAGLGKYCTGIESCVGYEALKEQATNGPARGVTGLVFETDDFNPAVVKDWDICNLDGARVGYLSGASMSPALGKTIGIGTIDKSSWDQGTMVVVHTPEGPREAMVAKMPFRV